MKIIAHRGNLSGPDSENENKPEAILKAIKLGFDVEVDLHVVNKELYLGHDAPQYKIPIDFLYNPHLWVHCKNKDALALMYTTKNIHYFWHQTDTYTITSKGYIWSYVGAETIDNAVCVLPTANQNVARYGAICTDYPLLYV